MQSQAEEEEEEKVEDKRRRRKRREHSTRSLARREDGSDPQPGKPAS